MLSKNNQQLSESGLTRWILGLAIWFGAFATATAQPVVLSADGPGNTYELIDSVLGGTAHEVPDCGHGDFGRHITEEWDDVLQTNVFVFHIHATPDNDRCINFDRQRNEVKTYDPSPANLVGTLGETHIYSWKFKLDSAFQASPNFTHVFQIKPKGGSDDSMPIITITLRYGNPDQMEVRFAPSNSGQTTVIRTDLPDLKGQWLAATCRVLYSETGKIELEVKKQDGSTALFYSNYLLDMWRDGASFNRPKWGIYRSLNSPSYLRDEQVRFESFSIEEPESGVTPETPAEFSATVVSITQIDLNWIDLSDNETNFLIQRSMNSTDWVNVATVDANVTSYSDAFLPPNLTFYYRVRAENWDVNSTFSNIDTVVSGVITGINDRPDALPDSPELLQNYPNPFNPQTTIKYQIATAGMVTLRIFDASGRAVQTLVSGHKNGGEYSVVWDAATVASGVYFARLETNGVSKLLKMLLLK